MRSTLLLALLALSFGLTAANLLLIRVLLTRHIADGLRADLGRSIDTFQNLNRQRMSMLHAQSALLADLPSLKALLTTRDRPTIQDAGTRFWELSGSDLFALLDPRGAVLASYNSGAPLRADLLSQTLQMTSDAGHAPRTLAVGDAPYVVAIEPVYFGPSATGTPLGFVAVGYALDQHLLTEVRQAAAAEVVFSVHGRIAASTLTPTLEASLRREVPGIAQLRQRGQRVEIDGRPYLSTATPLSSGRNGEEGVDLVVFKSYDEASRLLREVNRWGLLLGLGALLIAAVLAIVISRRITRPLEMLAGGATALGRGNYGYKLPDRGAPEVLELSAAFTAMRVALSRTQQELLASERLATIGRMASSISHDLRHHLSAVYANAEFLTLQASSQRERDELLTEIQAAVQDMTDLLDSLLIFSQTGKSFHPSLESINNLAVRTVAAMRSHPDAHGVEIVMEEGPAVEGWVDARKLSRAIYNLLLNACQAARRGDGRSRVEIGVSQSAEQIRIQVCDNGEGVSPQMRENIFQPFVSHGKESGTGLGLTLARHIAQEHGGRAVLSESRAGRTVFTIELEKSALAVLTESCSTEPERPNATTTAPEL